MIVNINYKGKFLESVDKFSFSDWKPRQYVQKCNDFTLVVFATGSCRIMGCKKELDITTLPYKIKVLKIQSMTVTANMSQSVKLFVSQVILTIS